MITNSTPLSYAHMQALAWMASDLFESASAELNSIGEFSNDGPDIAERLRAFAGTHGRSVERFLEMASTLATEAEAIEAPAEAEAAE